MFEPHFGLRENPFSTGHDARFLYPSPEHLEAVAHFRYGIQNREAFVCLTGEVGTGKTTAIYDLVSRLPQTSHVALINNSALTRLELLEEIARRFGVEPPATPSKPALLSALELRLSAHNGKGEPCILIVDEAQNLSNDVLEEIRLLSNLEDRGGHLMHICLVGQPELEEKLSRPELRQLRQRISVKYRLNPLSEDECARYIHHRLRVAGGEADRIFPVDATLAVHRLTHGIPREINIVASQAMVNAYVDGQSVVAPAHVRAVSDDFAFQSVLSGSPAPAPAPAAVTPPPVTPPPAPPVVAPPPGPTSAAPAAPTWHTPQSAPSPPPPAPAPPPDAGAANEAPRTVSNWRERRVPVAPPPPVAPVAPPAAPAFVPPPQAAPTPPPAPAFVAPPPVALPQATRPAAYTPQVVHSPAFERDAAVDDGEDDRARHTRRIILGILVLFVGVGGFVAYASGVLDRFLPGHGAATHVPVATAPASNSTPAASAPATTEPSPSASTPVPLPAAAASRTAFGIQVAAFRTANRAEHALKDLEDTTHLPGEVLVGDTDEGASWYRIVLGRFPDEAAAHASAKDLLDKSLIAEAIVIPYTPH